MPALPPSLACCGVFPSPLTVRPSPCSCQYGTDNNRECTLANIFFLDCCRDFKYEETRGTTPLPTGGNVISFACLPNHRAYDGAEVGHGLYTKCLLKHLLTPGIDIIEMLKRVGKDLRALAESRGCKQRSDYNSSLNCKLIVFNWLSNQNIWWLHLYSYQFWTV